MKDISEYIEQKFYEVLKHKISIQDFEQWVYNTNELESVLPKEAYIDLISLNYKAKYAHIDLGKIIEPFVDFGKFEILRITKHLESIIKRDEKCVDSIEMTYELYCSGYTFLRRLGLTYGLLIICPPEGNYSKSWSELSKEEQGKTLKNIYPKIIVDAQNALNWFKKGTIIIKNTVNEFGSYEYDDLRNQEEIIQGEIEVLDLEEGKKQLSKSKSNFWSNLKNWLS